MRHPPKTYLFDNFTGIYNGFHSFCALKLEPIVST